MENIPSTFSATVRREKVILIPPTTFQSSTSLPSLLPEEEQDIPHSNIISTPLTFPLNPNPITRPRTQFPPLSRRKQGFVLSQSFIDNSLSGVLREIYQLQNQILILNQRVDLLENRLEIAPGTQNHLQEDVEPFEFPVEPKRTRGRKSSKRDFKCQIRGCLKSFKSHPSLYIHYKCKHPDIEVSKIDRLFKLKENQAEIGNTSPNQL